MKVSALQSLRGHQMPGCLASEILGSACFCILPPTHARVADTHSHVWLLYVNAGDLNSSTHACRASARLLNAKIQRGSSGINPPEKHTVLFNVETTA